jgi:hypothetical protein
MIYLKRHAREVLLDGVNDIFKLIDNFYTTAVSTHLNNKSDVVCERELDGNLMGRKGQKQDNARGQGKNRPPSEP